MNLRLERIDFTEARTIGRLYVDGVFECWTLEDTVREPGVKVPGKTAIPAGTYRVVVDLSHRFGRMMMRLLKVPLFDGIRIHAGNKPEDTDGCILVGTSRTNDAVLHSRAALANLQSKVEASLAHGHDVTLEIVDERGEGEAQA